MQLDDNANENRKVAVGNLPCDFHVDGFEGEYAMYLERRNYTPESTGTILCYGLLIVGGLFMALVGALTILFGPDTVSYSRLTGPTLMQLVQLYPGPLFTLGALMVGVGNYLSNLNGEPPLPPEGYLLTFYEMQFSDMPDDPAQVSLVYLDGDAFHISLRSA